MKLLRSDLDAAANEGILEPSQAEDLWLWLENKKRHTPKFDLVHVGYYAGALLVMGAMGWLLVDRWLAFGGAALFFISLGYALTFVGVGTWLWLKTDNRIPAGLLITIAVSMVPLIIFGLQEWTGIWVFEEPGKYTDFYRWIKSGWFVMEVATILAGLVALYFFRFSFLTMPIAVALWFVSMDLTPIIAGSNEFTWELRKTVSMWFGLAMLASTFAVDRFFKKNDLVFWGYLFGLMAFWGGLSLHSSTSELGKFVYFLINLGLVGLSLYLSRVAFIVFGGVGIFLYLSHLAEKVFADSFMFPIALSAIGIALLFGAYQISKYRNQLPSS